ncbi:MAG: hypothetical protein R2839_04430 [Thermomicrobiales bacterium]
MITSPFDQHQLRYRRFQRSLATVLMLIILANLGFLGFNLAFPKPVSRLTEGVIPASTTASSMRNRSRPMRVPMASGITPVIR